MHFISKTYSAYPRDVYEEKKKFHFTKQKHVFFSSRTAGTGIALIFRVKVPSLILKKTSFLAEH